MGLTGELHELPIFDPAVHGWGNEDPESILVGPPGTGKTRAVLTAWLIPTVEEGLAGRFGVLGCSFTKAAAEEMKGRLVTATSAPAETVNATCRTIHSEAYRLVRRAYGDVAGVLTTKQAAKKLRKMDDDERRRAVEAGRGTPFMSQRQADLLAEEDETEIVDLAEALHHSPLDGLNGAGDDPTAEAIRLWDKARHVYPAKALGDSGQIRPLLTEVYADELEHRFHLDVLLAEVEVYEAIKQETGLIDFTDMLLLTCRLPAPVRDLVVVDEAQDLSPLQIHVIEHWATAVRYLVWVGDPDQGIYGFAGADGKHIHQRIRNGVPARRLAKSWRVPQRPHRLARDLILLTRDRIDAPYEPGDRLGQVAVARGEELERPLEWVLAGEGSVMIIARTKKEGLAPYAGILAASGVPFINDRSPGPWQARAKCELLLAMAALVSGRPLIGAEAKRLVESLPGRPRGAFYRGTKKAAKAWGQQVAEEGRIGLTPAVIEQESGALVEALARAGGVTLVLMRLGLVAEYGAQLAIFSAEGEAGLRDEPRICLTTIHGSKGREARNVLVDLAAPYPCRREIAQIGAEEERKVVYVAATRTEDRIVFRVPEARSHDLAALTGLDLPG